MPRLQIAPVKRGPGRVSAGKRGAPPRTAPRPQAEPSSPKRSAAGETTASGERGAVAGPAAREDESSSCSHGGHIFYWSASKSRFRPARLGFGEETSGPRAGPIGKPAAGPAGCGIRARRNVLFPRCYLFPRVSLLATKAAAGRCACLGAAASTCLAGLPFAQRVCSHSCQGRSVDAAATAVAPGPGPPTRARVEGPARPFSLRRKLCPMRTVYPSAKATRRCEQEGAINSRAHSVHYARSHADGKVSWLRFLGSLEGEVDAEVRNSIISLGACTWSLR